MNEAEKIKKRRVIIDIIENFFKNQKFVEVETPLLVAAPDPAPSNEVFETSISKRRAFLPPSPEFFMKKLVSLKMEKIFQICKAFRNPEELDPLHNPEFTILEWYRVGATYTDLMVDCENLINFIFQSLFSKTQNSHFEGIPQREQLKTQNHNLKQKTFLEYQSKKINITPPWLRISVKEAFKKYANIDLDKFLNFEKAKEISQKKGYQVEKNTTWEQLYHQMFLNEVEPRLSPNRATILYDYPAPLAALSKLKDKDPRYAERFEFYIGGLELGNGYSELTDWKEQEKRLINDIKIRKEKEMKVFDYDHDFIKALKTMPKTAGIAIGIDRLIMLFTDSKTIQEVIPFPATEIFK